MNTKKINITFLVLMIVFAITSISLLGLYTYEKKKASTITINYISNYYTETYTTDLVKFKTIILKVFSDDGTIYDLLNFQYSSYWSGVNGVVSVSKFQGSEKIVTTSNTLKLYFEYDVQVNSTGEILSDHFFYELEYEVLENGQLYFPSLINETYLNHNMASCLINSTYKIGFRLRLDYNTVTTVA